MIDTILVFGYCETPAYSRSQCMITLRYTIWIVVLTFNPEDLVSTTAVNPSRCLVAIQLSFVGWGNRFLKLRSVGVLWQENQRTDEEQWKDPGESVFCCERNLPLKFINLGG